MSTSMTPQEIAEYKSKWKMDTNNAVRLHSDLDWKGKDWCRRNLERHQWSMTTYTDFYEHTFLFEHEDNAIEFANQWPEYTNL